MNPLPLLMFDADAFQRGQPGRIGTASGEVRWGDTSVPWSARQLRVRIRADLVDDVRAVAGLAAAAREGRIRVGVSADVLDEQRDGRRWTRGWRSDVWRDVSIARLPAAFDWSHIVPWSSAQTRSMRESREAALDRLLEWAQLGVPAVIAGALAPGARSALADLPTFARILGACGVENRADALHLWSALNSHADCFVTCDRRFANALAHAGLTEARLVATPTEACRRFNVDPRDPPLADGETAWMIE